MEKRVITERMYELKKQEIMVEDRYIKQLDRERDVDRLLSLAMTNALMRMGGADKVAISEADLEMGHTEKRIGFL